MKFDLSFISTLLLLFLNSCTTIDTSVTTETCTIEGQDASYGYFVEHKPFAEIRGIDGAPVQVSNVRRVVVDAGQREIIVQTGEPDGANGSRYRTFRIMADLEQGKAYKIAAEFINFRSVVKVKEITGGFEKEVNGSISEVEGYRKRGWP